MQQGLRNLLLGLATMTLAACASAPPGQLAGEISANAGVGSGHPPPERPVGPPPVVTGPFEQHIQTSRNAGSGADDAAQ